jgi:hypothetical protein
LLCNKNFNLSRASLAQATMPQVAVQLEEVKSSLDPPQAPSQIPESSQRALHSCARLGSVIDSSLVSDSDMDSDDETDMEAPSTSDEEFEQDSRIRIRGLTEVDTA